MLRLDEERQVLNILIFWTTTNNSTHKGHYSKSKGVATYRSYQVRSINFGHFTGVCIIVYSFRFRKCLYAHVCCAYCDLGAFRLCFDFVDLLWCSIMDPTRRDPVTQLYDYWKVLKVPSALYLIFMLGKLVKNSCCRQRLTGSSNIFTAGSVFQEKNPIEHFIRLQTTHSSTLITILLSPEYSIHFLPIVCIKIQKSGSHSEQFRMSEDEYTLGPGFSELFLTSIAAWILDWVDSEVNAVICPLAVKILVKLNHIAHPLNLACISLAITRLNTGTSACRWPSLVR